MKHNFLRRLGALALVFALALSLLVTPAWAVPGDATDPIQRIEVQDKTVNLDLYESFNVPDHSSLFLTVYGYGSGENDKVTLDRNRYKLSKDEDEKGVIRVNADGTSLTAIGQGGAATIRVTLGNWVNGSFIPEGNIFTTFRVNVPGPVVSNTPKITVKAVGGDGIVASETDTSMNILLPEGGTMDLKATVNGSGTAYMVLTWDMSTADRSVVSCAYDNENAETATLTALKRGTATVTATLREGSRVVTTFVINVSVSDFTIEAKLYDTRQVLASNKTDTNNTVTLERDKTLDLYGSVIVGTYVDEDVSWSSDDSGLVSVSKGTNGKATLTASKERSGQTKITVTGHGVSTWFYVNVPEPGAVDVQSVTLNRSEIRLSLNEIFDLVATVLPTNAKNKEVVWKSGDESIARVDEKGRVTALKVGETTITVTSKYNTTKKATCKVIVSPSLSSLTIQNKTSSGQLNLNNNMTKPGNEQNLEVKVDPNNAYFNSIEWTSDNPSVATVRKNAQSSKGLLAILTVVAPGVATITAQCGDVKDTAKVTIPGLVISSGVLTMTNGKLTMKEGATEQLTYKGYGAAANLGSTTTPNWISGDSSVVDVDRTTGVITARKSGGPIKITLSLGNYEATCEVTVAEDTEGIITLTGNYPSGAPINMNTARGASDVASGTLPSVLNAISNMKTGAGLSYITNLSVASTAQGILHDEHRSADDTGAGVGIQDKYYINANTAQGQRPLSDLSFVPRNTFSGTAEITFTGWSTNRQPFNGTIRISVNGTGDVMYSSNEGAAVSFLASDFNFYHPNVKSVSFTPPQDSMGTLYYNYTSPSQPGTKVTSGTLYNRTGTPNIDKVTFVPASGYEGTVKISYKGTDTSGKSFTGVVTITVTKASGDGGDPADIAYSTKEDSWTTFRPSDFNTASLRVLGETLSYVRFTPPPSSEGTLFYNYRGFSDFDSMVNNTTNYYYSGSPSLGGVSFVPTTTTPSQVDIKYTGYSTRGNTFEGTIHIGLNDAPQQQQLLHYTVFTGKTVSLNAGDFNTACLAATKSNLASVQFTSLPGVSQGTLRYTRGNSSSASNVTTGTRFFRTGTGSSANLIGNVYFQAAANYTGTVTIPFTGTSENGTTFTDEVVITITPPTATDVTYSGTTASPIRLSASRIQSANGGVMNNVSYITFTTLPSSTAGKLYIGYSGFGTGTQVNTGTRYYVSGYPSIDQISFVPRGRYNGQVSVGYTATSASGESVNGRFVFSISSTGGSSYFSDMGNHAWAAPSVDYLYQNKVTNGVTATTFGPNQRILRGDFVLMLCRAFGFNGSNGYSFADVPTSAYFSQAVATAKQMGIVNGDGGNFKPYSPITRQDAMVIIKNALDAAGWNTGNASTSVLNQFSDSGSVSGYARNAVSTLVQLGAVNGDNGRLLPHNSITRAEAAVILHFVMTM